MTDDMGLLREYALAKIFYIGAYPANCLISRDGKIIGVDLFGQDLEAAVAKALAAKAIPAANAARN